MKEDFSNSPAAKAQNDDEKRLHASSKAQSLRQHRKPQTSQGRKKQNSKVIMQQKQRRRKALTFWRITKYGANSFVRNAWLSVAATAVMTVTLVIIFGSLLARSILMDTVEDIKNKVDMSIYLKKGVSDKDIAKMKKSIQNLKSVTSITYTSPQQAREKFASKNSSDADIRKALLESNNEFFGIFNIKLVNISDTTELKNLVDSDKLIKSNLDPDHPPTYASDRNEIIKNISNTINFAEKVGLLAGSIFVIIASLIIFNTIRMAIFNRREEIYMMKLIGANKSFIAGPFLVEAIICGTIAAVLATIIGYTIVFLSKSKLEAYGIIVSPIISFLQVYGVVVVLGLILIGSTIGVISAFTATRKYLKI